MLCTEMTPPKVHVYQRRCLFVGLHYQLMVVSTEERTENRPWIGTHFSNPL